MPVRADYSTAVQPSNSDQSFSSSGAPSAWRGRPSAISHQLTWVEVNIWNSGLMAFGSFRHPKAKSANLGLVLGLKPQGRTTFAAG